jgi:hypothetical protein
MLDVRTLTTVSRSDAAPGLVVWRRLLTLSSYISMVGGGGTISGGGLCTCRSGGAACDWRVKML